MRKQVTGPGGDLGYPMDHAWTAAGVVSGVNIREAPRILHAKGCAMRLRRPHCAVPSADADSEWIGRARVPAMCHVVLGC